MKGNGGVRTDGTRERDGRVSDRHVRATRPRVVVLLVVLTACLMAFPRPARADILDLSPFSFDGRDYGFVGPHSYSDTGHKAAVCEMLGFDWYSLSDEVKNIIDSGPNDFVTYANTVRNLQYDSPSSDFILGATRVVSSWLNIYGMDQIWYFGIDDAARDAARDFVATVIQEHGNGGGTSGGGSSGGGSSGSGMFVGNFVYSVGSTIYYFNGALQDGVQDTSSLYTYTYRDSYNGYIRMETPITVNVEIPSEVFSSYPLDSYAYVLKVTNDRHMFKPSLLIFPKDEIELDYETDASTNKQYINQVRYTGYYKTVSFNNYSYRFDSASHVTITGYATHTVVNSNSTGVVNRGLILLTMSSGSSTPEPPTYPPAPIGPTLPEPDTNGTTNEPQYPGPHTWIPINLPSITFPTETTGTDVIPYLKRIIANQESIASSLKTWFEDVCNTIADELAEHCNHIVSALETGFGYVADTITDEINDLQRYIHSVAHYLADVMVDLADGIESWLRRIYVKMRSGPGTGAPTITGPEDEEPFDFWAWLLEMIANIIGGIMGDATDAVSTLLNGMKELFPFSVPWDMMALLALLDGTRATPVFDVPIPAISGWWSAFNIHVDLSPYDGVASASRYMMMIWWLMVLLKQSTWMIEDVMGAVADKVGGFLTRLTRTGGA